MHQIIEAAKRRYTTKAFDAQHRLTEQEVADIETLLQLAPSSTNAQPWHFVIAGTDEGKARIAKATIGATAYNEPKVLNASHVVVLCSRAHITDGHLAQVLAQEERDGRFASNDAKEGQHRGRSMFVNLHRFERRDAQHWADKQAYIALGFLLLGAAAMGIDACPIEGFDSAVLDAELGLREQGLCSAVIVALGHHSEQDFNAKLPKSRLPKEQVITRL